MTGYFENFNGAYTEGRFLQGSFGVSLSAESGTAFVATDGIITEEFDYSSFSIGWETNVSIESGRSITILPGAQSSDITGQSVNMGVSLGLPFSVPFLPSISVSPEYVNSMDPKSPIDGWNYTYGIGASALPIAHFGVVNSTSRVQEE